MNFYLRYISRLSDTYLPTLSPATNALQASLPRPLIHLRRQIPLVVCLRVYGQVAAGSLLVLQVQSFSYLDIDADESKRFH